MFARNVPKFFWGDVVLTVCLPYQQDAHKSLNSKTPIGILKQHLPHINCLGCLPPKVFGCTIFDPIPNNNGSKLDPKATKCIFFLGYSPTQKGYKCYHLPTQRKFVSMDVSFFKTNPITRNLIFRGGKYCKKISLRCFLFPFRVMLLNMVMWRRQTTYNQQHE